MQIAFPFLFLVARANCICTAQTRTFFKKCKSPSLSCSWLQEQIVFVQHKLGHSLAASFWSFDTVPSPCFRNCFGAFHYTMVNFCPLLYIYIYIYLFIFFHFLYYFIVIFVTVDNNNNKVVNSVLFCPEWPKHSIPIQKTKQNRTIFISF